MTRNGPITGRSIRLAKLEAEYENKLSALSITSDAICCFTSGEDILPAFPNRLT